MTDASGLSELQLRILVVLSGLSPEWTLVGGGALVGFHLAHRQTRDLDLFFRPLDGLGEIGSDARSMLAGAGLTATEIKKTRDFVRLRVSSGSAVTIVDLVSEPAAAPLPPERASVSGVEIRVASRLELLASKICTLMNRAEIRDLADIEALLAAGEDFEEAMKLASTIDTGFSAPTLAWVIKDMDISKIARSEGTSDDGAAALAAFKARLIGMLLAGSRPAR